MRPRNVTLCPNTWELAMKKPNFSQWVRDKLLEEVKKNKDQWEKEWKKPYVDYEIQPVTRKVEE